MIRPQHKTPTMTISGKLWRGPLAWYRDHVRVGRETIYHISAHLGGSFLVWLVMGIALALPAGLWLVQANMSEMTAGWEGRPGLSIYFTVDVTDAEIDRVHTHLAALAEIDVISLTTPEQALEEFKALSGLEEELALLESNPLPALIRANFKQTPDVPWLDRQLEVLHDLAGVDEVVVEKTWIERLNDISSLVARLGWVLAGLFGIGAILVTAASVRLAMEGQLEEIKVLKLVGASAAQLRRPFLYFGLIYGFGGGVIAAMVIAMTVAVVEPPLQSLLGSYQQSLELAGFDPSFLLTLLGIGSGLGTLGAVLAVRQRLRDIEIF